MGADSTGQRGRDLVAEISEEKKAPVGLQALLSVRPEAVGQAGVTGVGGEAVESGNWEATNRQINGFRKWPNADGPQTR